MPKEEICRLTSYNYAAAAGGVAYGNPWQLIWVFDGDPGTTVVCEGYSKAFKYLCDMTSFSDDINCITATGLLIDESGSGAHMWNIVTMEDRKNYLVDVTNCDEGSIGAPDLLFMKGYYDTIEYGYTFLCDFGYLLGYSYDEMTQDVYLPENLILSPDDYKESNTHKVIFDGNGICGTIFELYVEDGKSVLETINGYAGQDIRSIIWAAAEKDGVRYVPSAAFTSGYCLDPEGTQYYDLNTPVTGNLTLYADWLEVLHFIEVSALPGVCGTEVSTPENEYGDPDFSRQENPPVVSAAEGAAYSFAASWRDDNYEGLNAVLTGGEDYTVAVQVDWDDREYTFDGDYTEFAVTGGELLGVDGDESGVTMYISLAVEHDMTEWETAESSTCQKAGLEERHCAGCDLQETAVLPKAEHTAVVDTGAAAIVTFLWRYAGKPVAAGAASFSDMTDNEGFNAAISWASEQEITTGYEDNTFRPWANCKRLAIVTFLWRYAEQ